MGVAASLLLLGIGFAANTPTQIAAWKEAAATGDVKAQWYLAKAYEYRDGMDSDPGRELTWKHSAAEGGVAAAQYSLAANYFQGELGLSRDVRTAVNWLRRAALQGHVEASYRLGEIAFHGLGGEKVNYAQAAAAMKKPAEENYRDARMYLGYMKFTGLGMAKNRQEGAALLRAAAKAGHERAEELMWEAYTAGTLEPNDEKEKLRWIEAGNRQNDPRAKERLGLALFMGQGVAQDRGRARPLLLEAAERGSVPAATALAQEIGEQLSTENAILSAEQRQALILEYNRMAHLIAVSGGVAGMETYIRAITHLRPMEKLVARADNRMSVGEELIEAIAWGRIYHAENGRDTEVLAWSDAAELWLMHYPPAILKVRQKVAELLKQSATAREK